MSTGTQWLWVAAGGALGALGRFWTGHLVHLWLPRSFPWGTLVANLAGGLLIGMAYVLVVQRPGLDPAWRMALVVGFLGAFTTFSTFSLENLLMLQQGEWLRAVLYMFLSLAGCIAAAWAGTIVGRFFL